MERRVVRRSQSQFGAPDGTRLFRRAWLPCAPRRTVVLVHGLAEHSGRYDHVGAWLATRECAVHAFDHRGHGRSEGVRGHVGAFSELLDDVEGFLEILRREHPGLPLVLVGHSMGGLITTALLSERKPDVTCAAVSGTPLELPEHVSSLRRRLARWLRRLAPQLQLSAGLDPEALSRDPSVVRDYVDDPLVFPRVTVSLATELLAAVTRTAATAFEVRVPMLLLHGEADRLCPARGSRIFHGQLHGRGHRLRVYPQLRHEIFNEPEQEQVLEDLLEWLLERER
ncbi:alpha/beta hydrolase [Myxococcota bacterium]|nr:alpha/beta hydrolase [Myxococcota bacterium]MCZ7617157.1 lysophospholipase [Myxococcota bacterium]